MPGIDVHVVPVGDRCAVETEGVGRETFDTQDEAISAGAERAKQKKRELHGRDGQIRELRSFGNDPRNIPG